MAITVADWWDQHIVGPAFLWLLTGFPIGLLFLGPCHLSDGCAFIGVLPDLWLAVSVWGIAVVVLRFSFTSLVENCKEGGQ